jgi:hypothetical protein
MGAWQPDRTDDVASRDAHLWIVPAKLGGKWSVRVADDPPLLLELRQQFQHLEGHAVVGGNRVLLERVLVRGPRVSFELPGGTAGTMRFEGTADDAGRVQGTASTGAGQRKPFTATRS